MIAIGCPHACGAEAAGISTAGSTDYPNGGMRRAGGLTLNGAAGESKLTSGVIDAANGYAYFGTNTRPGNIVKVKLGDSGNPVKVATLTLPMGEDFLETAVIDATAGFAYFGTHTVPASVVKVSLGAGDAAPARVGTLTLNAGEDFLHSSLIDPATGYAYFGCGTNPGKVVKLALNGAAVPTRLGVATFLDGEEHLLSAVMDSANNYGYFGTEGNPGYVVKVALGSGNAAPSRVGAVKVNAGEGNFWSAVIDPAHGAAYFGSHLDPGTVVKINLGSGSSAPTRAGSLTLGAGEGLLHTAAIDAARGAAFFGSSSRLIKVGISGANPAHAGSLQLDPGEVNFTSAVIDPAAATAYLGSETDNGHVVKVALSQLGAVKATRMTLTENADLVSARLFSHTASGNVRLAIYADGSPKTLLWESGAVANPMTGDVIVIPIASGTPATLSLSPGTYWLAWQVDSDARVPSFVQGGGAGDGFAFSQGFGAFPASLADGALMSTAEKWTEYIVYNRPGVPPGANGPPVIGSAPSATPNPARAGENVILAAMADDPDFDVLSYSWNFGDGSSGSGASATHVYNAGGSYTASLTVSDGNGGTATGSVNVVVNSPRVGGGSDSDGDGFSDSFEIAAGSNPNNAASTPLGGAPASEAKPLSLTKMSVKLNFAKPGSDAIAVAGTLPVSDGFAAAGQPVTVGVGGVVRTFTLDAKGGAKTGNDAIKIGIKGKKGVVAAQTSKFALKLSKGNFANTLADEGLTGVADVKAQTRSVTVTVLFDHGVYQAEKSLLYSAKAGKTGSAK